MDNFLQNSQGSKNVVYDPEMDYQTAMVSQSFFQKAVRIVWDGKTWWRYGSADGKGDLSQRTALTGTEFVPQFSVRGVRVNELESNGRRLEFDLMQCTHVDERFVFGITEPNGITRLYLRTDSIYSKDTTLKG